MQLTDQGSSLAVCMCAADGTLGGRHYLITASVGAGSKLYIMKVQAGDKVQTCIAFQYLHLALNHVPSPCIVLDDR
jgi:hypothetical protein